MEGCSVYDDSHMTNVLLKNERIPCTSEVLDSLWVPNSSPSFHDVRGENNTKNPLFCNEELDVCFHQPEKKRRLSPEQVKFLEKSFEVENKLEPDRKVQLAKELGLQPRQIAIWFQNRRARYKTKLLEKDYDSLKANYDKLKTDYDALYIENEKLKNEVHLLTEKLLVRENGKLKQEPPCDPISPLDFQPKNLSFSPDDESNVVRAGRSNVFDSDSSDSSHVFEQDPSDFSQDEDDRLSRRLLQPSCFPKIEVEYDDDDDLQPNSCNLGFPVQDQGTWFWQY